MTSSFAHTSDSDSWYTPPAIVEAARALMGGIDLDPASSAKANEVVKADVYFDEAHNGFARDWIAPTGGRVFLNPPGGYCDADGRRVIRANKGKAECRLTGACGLAPGHDHYGTRSAAKAWWEKLVDWYVDGVVEQAVFVGFNSEILRSTQVNESKSKLCCLDFPICWPKQRVRYFQEQDGKLVEGAAPPHDSVIVWLPPSVLVGSGAEAKLVCPILEWTSELTQHFGQFGRCR
jgi:hypothetical protein